MYPFKGLEPTELWSFFYDICQIPRPSKSEGQIIEYLIKFGAKYNLDTKTDGVGNVLISKPATSKMQNAPSLVLQSHVDMVCEKNSDCNHDFSIDPIVPRIENGWVKATGTTLGADDGIGVAAQLAILASKNIEHGPLECLFTVDEETGLTGAHALKSDFVKSRILLNLDSEDEGELYIGCAGGIDNVARFDVITEPVPDGSFYAKVNISGLTGGHSGDDINRGLANANKILVSLLLKFDELFNARISSISGGNLRNAIAREAEAIFVVPSKFKENLRVEFNVLSHEIEQEFKATDPAMKLHLQSTDAPDSVFRKDLHTNLLQALQNCPHGVISMSPTIEGLVQTSTNLASVKMVDGQIVISTSQRSSVEDEKRKIAQKVKDLFERAGAKVMQSDGYPGWEPNLKSSVLDLGLRTYKELFGIEPKVKAIHAGLECGLFLEKYPDMDMISFGPTIKGPHSPDERLDIESVGKFWQYLVALLAKT